MGYQLNEDQVQSLTEEVQEMVFSLVKERGGNQWDMLTVLHGITLDLEDHLGLSE
jgi:hypothetical protein